MRPDSSGTMVPSGADQLDSVAEGIEDVATLDAGDRVVWFYFQSGILESRDEFGIIVATQRGMRSARGVKVRINPEMDLNVATREPAATALFQFGGFVDFGHAQQSGVERASLLLHSRRHGELDVIDGGKGEINHL